MQEKILNFMFSLLYQHSDAILSPKIILSQLFLITTFEDYPKKFEFIGVYIGIRIFVLPNICIGPKYHVSDRNLKNVCLGQICNQHIIAHFYVYCQVVISNDVVIIIAPKEGSEEYIT